jgi:hypothetical protein
MAGAMIALYLISIVIAWLVGLRYRRRASGDPVSSGLRLVAAGAVVDRARRHCALANRR